MILGLSAALLLWLMTSGPAISGATTTAPVVMANGEELHGAWDGEDRQIAVFRGVPFAQPPVADLRWRAPVPNTPRPGPQSATRFAPGCMQTSYSTDWYARVAVAFGNPPEVAARPSGVSEDCLYLNVWSPDLKPDRLLPVMVWVHGGSNRGGWSYEPNYIGHRLASRGVVVVSIAYRLGVFGFFSHPALDNGLGEPVANFGWLDSGQALRWVAANIAGFGGDPDNITAFGESAGAADLSDLLSAGIDDSPAFRRMIAQSSATSLHQRRKLSDEQARGQRLIDSLDLEGPLSANRLREIPSHDLLAAMETQLQGVYFDTVIDGLTMIEAPIDALNDAQTMQVDVLIGTNADEWYMYIDENSGRAELERWLHEYAPDQAEQLLREIESEPDARRAMDRIRTAGRMMCPSRILAGRVSDLGASSWVYYFTRQRAGPGGEKLGAYHGTEIPYVFDMHDDWLPTEAEDRVLTEAVMDYWVQFARTGNPNLPTRPAWPQFSNRNPTVMALGDKIHAMTAPDARLCELLDPDRPANAVDRP
jgi:para-nitrobenzyl esterase